MQRAGSVCWLDTSSQGALLPQDYAELSIDEKKHCAGRKGAMHLWQSHEAQAPQVDPELNTIAQADFGKVRTSPAPLSGVGAGS